MGLHGDGQGLYLKVTKTSSKSWIYRYARDKKVHDIGLGSVLTVSLPEAREKALEYRHLIQSGKDPLRAKREQEIETKRANHKLITFAECSTQYIDTHKAGWKNAKHAQQWINTIKTYALPIIGDLPVRDIDTPLIMRVLTPIWTSKNETAGRVRGRIENILSWAAVHGYREADNPARWKGHLENLLAKPSKVKKVKHHKALPYKELYKLMRELRANGSISSLARNAVMIGAGMTRDQRKESLSIMAELKNDLLLEVA